MAIHWRVRLTLQIDRKSSRPKDNLTDLNEVLQSIKPSEFKDNHLAAFKVIYHSIEMTLSI